MAHDFDESDVRFDVVFAERLIEEQISNLPKFRFAIVAVAGKEQKNPYLLGIIVFAQSVANSVGVDCYIGILNVAYNWSSRAKCRNTEALEIGTGVVQPIDGGKRTLEPCGADNELADAVACRAKFKREVLVHIGKRGIDSIESSFLVALEVKKGVFVLLKPTPELCFRGHGICGT